MSRGVRQIRKKSLFDRVSRQFKGFKPSILRKTVATLPQNIPESRRKKDRRGGGGKVIPTGPMHMQRDGGMSPLSDTITVSSYVINHEGAFKVRWEMVLCILILYSAITVPYLLSFDDEVRTYTSFWYLEIAVDTFFITDLVLNFFTSYYDSGTLGKTRVKSHVKIANNYLKSKWFPIDFLSSIPFD